MKKSPEMRLRSNHAEGSRNRSTRLGSQPPTRRGVPTKAVKAEPSNISKTVSTVEIKPVDDQPAASLQSNVVSAAQLRALLQAAESAGGSLTTDELLSAVGSSRVPPTAIESAPTPPDKSSPSRHKTRTVDPQRPWEALGIRRSWNNSMPPRRSSSSSYASDEESERDAPADSGHEESVSRGLDSSPQSEVNHGLRSGIQALTFAEHLDKPPSQSKQVFQQSDLASSSSKAERSTPADRSETGNQSSGVTPSQNATKPEPGSRGAHANDRLTEQNPAYARASTLERLGDSKYALTTADGSVRIIEPADVGEYGVDLLDMVPEAPTEEELDSVHSRSPSPMPRTTPTTTGRSARSAGHATTHKQHSSVRKAASPVLALAAESRVDRDLADDQSAVASPEPSKPHRQGGGVGTPSPTKSEPSPNLQLAVQEDMSSGETGVAQSRTPPPLVSSPPLHATSPSTSNTGSAEPLSGPARVDFDVSDVDAALHDTGNNDTDQLVSETTVGCHKEPVSEQRRPKGIRRYASSSQQSLGDVESCTSAASDVTALEGSSDWRSPPEQALQMHEQPAEVTAPIPSRTPSSDARSPESLIGITAIESRGDADLSTDAGMSTSHSSSAQDRKTRPNLFSDLAAQPSFVVNESHDSSAKTGNSESKPIPRPKHTSPNRNEVALDPVIARYASLLLPTALMGFSLQQLTSGRLVDAEDQTDEVVLDNIIATLMIPAMDPLTVFRRHVRRIARQADKSGESIRRIRPAAFYSTPPATRTLFCPLSLPHQPLSSPDEVVRILCEQTRELDAAEQPTDIPMTRTGVHGGRGVQEVSGLVRQCCSVEVLWDIPERLRGQAHGTRFLWSIDPCRFSVVVYSTAASLHFIPVCRAEVHAPAAKGVGPPSGRAWGFASPPGVHLLSPVESYTMLGMKVAGQSKADWVHAAPVSSIIPCANGFVASLDEFMVFKVWRLDGHATVGALMDGRKAPVRISALVYPVLVHSANLSFRPGRTPGSFVRCRPAKSRDGQALTFGSPTRPLSRALHTTGQLDIATELNGDQELALQQRRAANRVRRGRGLQVTAIAAVGPSFVAAGTAEGTVFVVDVESDALVMALPSIPLPRPVLGSKTAEASDSDSDSDLSWLASKGHRSVVSTISYCGDGYVAVGDEEGIVSVWDLTVGICLQAWKTSIADDERSDGFHGSSGRHRSELPSIISIVPLVHTRAGTSTDKPSVDEPLHGHNAVCFLLHIETARRQHLYDWRSATIVGGTECDQRQLSAPKVLGCAYPSALPLPSGGIIRAAAAGRSASVAVRLADDPGAPIYSPSRGTHNALASRSPLHLLHPLRGQRRVKHPELSSYQVRPDSVATIIPGAADPVSAVTHNGAALVVSNRRQRAMLYLVDL